MIGRSSAERKYQLAAQKRNEVNLKFDYYQQTARYFEREFENAKHFNRWNVESYKPIYWEQLKKKENLKFRQEKLRKFLQKEDIEYQREFDNLKSKKYIRKEVSFEELRNKLKETRAEQSLYNPRVYRRIQSYFYPTNSNRSILREVNNSKNMDSNGKSNIDYDEKDLTTQEHNTENFNKRSDDFKENQFNSETSTFGFNYGNEDLVDYPNDRRCYGNEKEKNTFDNKQRTLDDSNNDELDKSTSSNLDKFKEDTEAFEPSKFGFQKHSWDNKVSSSGGYTDAQESDPFQNTYHLEHSPEKMDRTHVSKDFDKNSAEAHQNTEDFNERARSFKTNQHSSESSQFGFNYLNEDWDNKLNSGTDNSKALIKETYGEYPVVSMYEKKEGIASDSGDNDDDDTHDDRKYAERYSRRSLEQTNIASGLSNEVSHKQNTKHVAIASELSTNENKETGESFDTVDLNIFENILSKKMSDIDIHKDEKKDNLDDKLSKEEDRTEKICQYLTYADLKGKIQDLEKREMRASNKQCWEEALRLKEMRNRLELIKEKQIYQRKDLQIDPEFRKKVLSNIDFRSQQLEKREKLCNNSSMYSEEAKITWDKWMNEDKNFDWIEDYKVKRDALIKHLEADWQALAEDDKKRLSSVYTNVMSGSSLQSELKSLVEKSFH